MQPQGQSHRMEMPLVQDYLDDIRKRQKGAVWDDGPGAGKVGFMAGKSACHDMMTCYSNIG